MKDIKTLMIGIFIGIGLMFLFDSKGRYQGFANNSDKFLLDTKTGETWKSEFGRIWGHYLSPPGSEE